VGGVVVALADTILADLAALEGRARAGQLAGSREYIGQMAGVLYQKLGTEARALNARYRDEFGECPRPSPSPPGPGAPSPQS
jgi:hypothetical protein